MLTESHWGAVYGTRAPDAVSWYAPHRAESLTFIQKTRLPKSAAVIDVGGGEATLVASRAAAASRLCRKG
jgi:hypothetical protein